MTKIIITGLLLSGLLLSCTRSRSVEQYISFPDSTWYRFNKMNFELPVRPSGKAASIVFFTRCTRDFPYTTLDFNMVMDSPSGEERIKEDHLAIKDTDGNFKGTFQGDSCYMEIILVKSLQITEKGLLRIELENLVPRVKTPGLLGVGIRIDYP
jgi:gliding motility-associated lipoprotein GldH